MITNDANALILTAVITESIDNLDVLSISTSAVEVFRKAYQNKETISSTERKYTFYLTEAEANVTMTKLSLYGDGATTTLASGTEMVYANVNITKTSTQSLLITWTVKVVS